MVISLSADATKETKETNEDGSYIIIAMQIGSSTLSSGFGMYYCKLGICSCWNCISISVLLQFYETFSDSFQPKNWKVFQRIVGL